ncbi:putative O-glycosylation ligase, exosortase A system-associated [Solimicrobium silvestre]|uniref:Putative O-glycosylation ligase, exosortase A-associated n=1 Tax=Solimicrobium silvestre TaxID=2099400 RepID=A0A2S9GTB7_9BURK|nr:putative O-glycosylation ligase, exosortase A system-associated [Solimicrobium silvestre]PRC90964.1 putative O-glycosylation ligase, exosortase A-associated [Solimicrobium silvestre]
MRDIALFILIFSILPFVFKKPFIGVLLFTWVSLMNPHRLTYGAAYDFPFAAVIVVVTLISLLVSNQKKNFPVTGLTITLLVFVTWMTLTTFYALEPTRAWAEWSRVMKTMILVAVILLTINTKQEIQALAWTIGLSLGFFGFKGGVFTILSGGSSHVFGPEGSYITDNNALALALVTALPLIWYVQLSVTQKILRYGFIGLTMLTVIAAVGSYSRGALLGGAAMFFFLWLKNRQKIRTGIILLLIVVVIYAVMPAQWFDRMHTIDNYQQDSSALGRINAWGFAINVASANLMGGGFDCFTNRLFVVYAPEPYNQHAAHSIYFQVVGEHGFVGISLFLLFMFLAWRTGTRVLKFCKDREDLKWASDLAAMCQVSIIGYAIGGAFLTLAYYDLYYDIVAVLILLEKLLLSKDSLTSNATAEPEATAITASNVDLTIRVPQQTP